MARKPIKTVRLERQPHKEAMQRLRMAYQQLLAATNQPASAAEPKQKQSVQEVKPCQ